MDPTIFGIEAPVWVVVGWYGLSALLCFYLAALAVKADQTNVLWWTED